MTTRKGGGGERGSKEPPDTYPDFCNEDSSGQSESESEEMDDVEEAFFAVRSDAERTGSTPVEHDVIESRCKELRTLMRERPTLPLKAGGRKRRLGNSRCTTSSA